MCVFFEVGESAVPVAEGVAVEGLDGDQGLLVVRHRHEAEALALVRLQVTDDLNICKYAIYVDSTSIINGLVICSA